VILRVSGGRYGRRMGREGLRPVIIFRWRVEVSQGGRGGGSFGGFEAFIGFLYLHVEFVLGSRIVILVQN
jgi:hypothetical protein